MKKTAILNLILSIIFLLWFALFITSNGRISTQEFAGVGFSFGIWSLLFSIAVIRKSRVKQ